MKVDGGTFQIFIRNENHTHSHLNTRADAASYMTTKTLPIDEQDREDVKTLADARASSKQITDFLNDRRWGETLAMEFTHGTNNLGYHLDFIYRDQQAVTISAILTYFKEKNPGVA
ncbi:hypothetical protein PPTG_02779 [Phytophthora nicotianae INRA-310]|uniref:Uncharacterized protein n=1 Tax=Phytophthora nicotianae (strain INRA-310) TaxID=761204 RepID=W2RCE3_PHYN3|nr:hypothetical protein PPTG_02779 [Phytophthora nicotianae INRA-310]ETN23093.1 hypothetical protein PPTG_02779 [Phytophthora nicotianae INRA-310]